MTDELVTVVPLLPPPVETVFPKAGPTLDGTAWMPGSEFPLAEAVAVSCFAGLRAVGMPGAVQAVQAVAVVVSLLSLLAVFIPACVSAVQTAIIPVLLLNHLSLLV